MMDISRVHPYSVALFHSMLAEQNKKKELIEKTLNDYYGRDPIHLENEEDYAYILHTQNYLILSVSGTKSLEGWFRNARMKTVNGMHGGFLNSFYRLIHDPFMTQVALFRGKIQTYGHSAGDAISKIAAYHVRRLNRTEEHIGICGPACVDVDGHRAFKEQKVCSTRLFIGNHDQVDNVHEYLPMLKGKHYGYSVELPDMGPPNISPVLILDELFFGHAPSYVIKCLKQLYINWKLPMAELNFLDEIKHLAIR